MTLSHQQHPSAARAFARRRMAAAVAGPLVLCALLAGCAAGPGGGTQTGASATGAVGTPPAGTALQAHSHLIEAFNSCNEAAFVGAFAPLFTLATSNTKQPLTTREGLQAYLRTGCASRPHPSAAVVQQSVRVSGAVTVLAGQYRFKVTLGAAPGAGAAGAPAAQAELLQNFTLVLERMGERWLVLAHHVSVAP